MARTVRPLSDNEIKKAKKKEKDYKMFDGGGLFLLVRTNGSKLWRAKYRYDGKEKSISFGKYPEVTLAAARNKLQELKKNLENNLNPSRKTINTLNEKTIRKMTFKEISLEFLKFKSQELSYSYYEKQKRRLEVYVYYKIGNIEADDVKKSDIIELLKNIPNIKTSSTKKTNKAETSRIVFNLLEQIYNFGFHNDFTSNNVMSRVDKNAIIPKTTTEHYKAITDEKEIRSLYSMIQEYQGDISTRSALEFLALSALRTGNVRFMKWEMIDFDKRVVNYPSSAMKTKREFRLPLTNRMMKILKDMREFTGDFEYVFHSTLSKKKPLSENTLGYALKRMDVFDHTPHGFRSSFSTLCYEKQKEHGFIADVIESQLAHSVGSSTKRAYMRSDFFDERLKLLEWWDEFLHM